MSSIPPAAKDSDIYNNYYSRAHAESLDEQDSLKHLRQEFIIPTKNDLKSRTLAKSCEFHCQKKTVQPTRFILYIDLSSHPP